MAVWALGRLCAAMLMKPYLAVKDDVIFVEDEVGDDMFMVTLSLPLSLSPSLPPSLKDPPAAKRRGPL